MVNWYKWMMIVSILTPDVKSHEGAEQSERLEGKKKKTYNKKTLK